MLMPCKLCSGQTGRPPVGQAQSLNIESGVWLTSLFPVLISVITGCGDLNVRGDVSLTHSSPTHARIHHIQLGRDYQTDEAITWEKFTEKNDVRCKNALR